MELCRRAETIWGWIVHLLPQVGGRYLLPVHAAVKHCLPLFKDFSHDLKATSDSPHSARLVLPGYGEFMNVEGNEEARIVCTSPMDGKLASYLVPESNNGANPSTVLLNKQCCLSADQLVAVLERNRQMYLDESVSSTRLFGSVMESLQARFEEVKTGSSTARGKRRSHDPSCRAREELCFRGPPPQEFTVATVLPSGSVNGGNLLVSEVPKSGVVWVSEWLYAHCFYPRFISVQGYQE
jgi:hypothetical protein